MSSATEVHEPEVKKPVEERPKSQISASLQTAETRPLFSDCLLESGGVKHGRFTAATLFSFILQCLLVGVAILMPLMFTEALPKQQLLSFLVAPPPPPPPPPPAAAEAASRVIQRVSEISDGHLRTPGKIPQKIQMIKEDEAPPPSFSTGGVVGGVPGGIPGGQMGGVIGGIISSTSNLSAVPKLAAPKRIRISQGVTEGRLIQKIQPEYPTIAKAARIQGSVVLSAVISKTGEIENLVLISGHPMLVPAAIKAVQQFRYRPFLLNGEPVEVETTITVNFQLS
ncbi:MAG: energy transducer TonB [Candidatus Sulfotelmatobacter sp.]|jgi:protein TonB